MTKLPSEKAKEQKEKLDQEAKKTEVKREVFSRLFQTDDGKVLFDWLSYECGFAMPNNVLNAKGEFNLSLIAYNEGRRNLYLQLRDFVHRDVLVELERKKTEY